MAPRRVLKRIEAQAPAPNPVKYESVAPVVASVVTPLPVTAEARPEAVPPSRLRVASIGAIVGLLLVGAFVTGTRLAFRARHPDAPTSAAAQANPQPPQAAVPASPPAAAARAIPAAVAPAGAAPASTVPVYDANELPTARVVRRALPPRSRPRAAPSPVDPSTPVEVTAAAPASASPAPAVAAPAAAVASDSTAETEAPSLVPVIPDAPAPTVDSLVKAVQTDIEEDESAKRR